MYRYTELDYALVRQRAAQYRDQLQRFLSGRLGDDEFKPLRLQNGWYLQRHAPMLRVAVPYGVLSSTQLRALARIAREYDRGYGHFTTRQNIQFNWIPLERSADVMDLLADVGMHGIQTSGNCIRNVTTDAFAGIAEDEIADPRPFAEVLRQWSTMHPEFAYLPRKFKVAISGATEDRAATAWHDIGLQLHRNAAGELGFRVRVGGGMGRTPIIGTVVREFLPWPELLTYLEAILRVYNLHGRRDNIYKARIKILVKSLGPEFAKQVEEEYQAIAAIARLQFNDELARVSKSFEGEPEPMDGKQLFGEQDALHPAFARWRARQVRGHRLAGYAAVTLSFKRVGQAPGDITDAQMEAVAQLADEYSQGELRVTHEQNVVLPYAKQSELFTLWQRAKALGLATPNHHLLSDMICCPGGDFCSLANAKSIPIAEAIWQRFDDIDYLHDLGELHLNISGCINSCGHHHAGHIGILGVDKDGSEWYQVSLGGSSGDASGGDVAQPGKVIGPSFAADEVPEVIAKVLEVYVHKRDEGEIFVDTVRRLGLEPFKHAVYDKAHVATAATAEEGAL
jgi:sulfite reductase (NADPH) hemoprotein beta-component